MSGMSCLGKAKAVSIRFQCNQYIFLKTVSVDFGLLTGVPLAGCWLAGWLGVTTRLDKTLRTNLGIFGAFAHAALFDIFRADIFDGSLSTGGVGSFRPCNLLTTTGLAWTNLISALWSLKSKSGIWYSFFNYSDEVRASLLLGY